MVPSLTQWLFMPKKHGNYSWILFFPHCLYWIHQQVQLPVFLNYIPNLIISYHFQCYKPRPNCHYVLPKHLKFHESTVINFPLFAVCFPTLECKLFESRDFVFITVVFLASTCTWHLLRCQQMFPPDWYFNLGTLSFRVIIELYGIC